MPYLFSYGSNSPRQLGERLDKSIRGQPAYVEGYLRAFRGWSRKWQGGVATLIKAKDPNGKTYGYITKVTEADLDILDGYEGVPTNYRRKTLTVTTNEGDEVEAIAYIATSKDRNQPSNAYLDAVAETISSFWSEGGRTITRKDITIRNPR